jgi:hypothetical protein
MEPKNDSKKSIWLNTTMAILATIPVVVAILIILLLWDENDVFRKITLNGLIILVFISSGFFAWLYFQYVKRSEDRKDLLIENGKKREQEELQLKLNLYYRLEALKWEKLHSVIKEITEKKEYSSKENEKTITFSINHSLIQEIKKVMNEIDKIN